ncbi:DsbA family protein [Burkholderia cepacia]|uniref:DsbA family protein n=1 Tax=Burkholderia cepacia TaxID=292 RepID=UPI002AB6E87E|nr:thioredoxin domain-containing protein [Burkholderia cepacia]
MRKLAYVRAFVPTVRHLVGGLVVAAILGIGGGWIASHFTPGTARPSAMTGASPSPRGGPPWIYGRADARFTVLEYADLECPYCRAYFPVLKGWIDAHPEVNWRWQHLPLEMHNPAASAEARIAECVGQAGGQAAFWKAVAWIYAHTRGEGQGLSPDARYPHLTLAAQHCLASDRPDATIRTQVAEAAKIGIQATPTLRLSDRQSGKSIVLPGPVDGDALLSAVDWLTASGKTGPSASRRHAD